MKIRIRIFFILVLLNLVSLSILAQEPDHKRPKIGLVLSGGGAKGLAHVGVLKVLEEAGIRPDYIAGTSMGSIVGGLYSIGYDADSLEKISTNANWPYLLTDEISRKNLTIEEKDDADRFILSFPIKENKIKIPSGLIDGQNIENLLNTLCAPVYNVRDFSKFQIPFLCVATDIETGKEVIFREGYLPEILRASMSIPSIFNPIEIDSTLLVDGGVVNNFPALRVKEMGADIIIGVDVGFQYYKKDQLHSIFRIIEQSVFFYGERLNRKNKELVDILIEPDMDGYNASSFNADDSIIARGEREARKYLPAFKALADSLRNMDPDYGPKQDLPALDSMTLMEIRVRGLDRVSGKLLTGKLQLEVFDKVTAADIADAVNRLYSSLYFDKISYEIESLQTGVRLLIKVDESRGGDFRVGLHYDSDNKSAILLNTTVRNLMIDGSKLSLSSALGENPFLQASFFKNNGWKPGYGLNVTTSRNRVFAYENGKKISSFNYYENIFQLYTQSIFSNSYALGAGIEYEITSLRPEVDPLLGIDTSGTYFNYYAFLDMDTYDNAFYPKKGIKFNSEFKIITNHVSEPALFLVFRYSQAFSLGNNLTYINHLYGGAVDGRDIPYQYYFYTGGVNPNRRNGILPFTGLDYMERVSMNALVLGGDFQFELFPDIYLIVKGNVANLKDDFDELLKTDNILGGYGLTAGYDSWIGPIEISVSKSANRSGINGFLNIGFWF